MPSTATATATAMASSSMSPTTVQSISDILVDIYNSTDGIRSLSISSPPPQFQFGSNVANLPLALHTLSDDDSDENLLESLKSLNDYLKRIHASIGPHLSVQFLEDFARGLGRCIGLVAEAWVHAPEDVRSKLGVLHREMLKGVVFEGEIVEVSAEEEPVVVDVVGEEVLDLEGLATKVKTAEDGEALIKTLMELEVLIRNGLVETEDEGSVGVVVSALVGRLGGVREEGRIKILMLLKMLATKNALYEEIMADFEVLTIIVRSLARDINESREAVVLLLNLSEITRIRQKIGRVQGCIVMLVILSKEGDPHISSSARKLLYALSSNTQNVLLMSEAGYFGPIVDYLKQGSDMIKIVMATSLSRMNLSDQMQNVLGQEGSIEPLVNMFISGKLEAKISSLGALKNLSTIPENALILINCGIVTPLLELLFSVTSVFVTLKEPAAAILACISQSQLILSVKDIAQQILSLINLSKPAIQCHLLNALGSIASHSRESKVRCKMNNKSVLQLIEPFLFSDNDGIRRAALDLLYALSKDLTRGTRMWIGETHLSVLVGMVSTSTLEGEKATAAGILCNLPTEDKKITGILMRLNLLPILILTFSLCFKASPTGANKLLLENIVGVMVRFTVPWDSKLQRVSVDLGVIHLLVKVLSIGSPIAQSRAATSLAQLSQNSLSLSKSKQSRWMCGSSSSEAFCQVHRNKCTVKRTFCLVKASSISPLVQILRGKEREADEAVLIALSTLIQDEMWENGSNAIDKASGIDAIIGILEVGNPNAQKRALWMLERIFRIESHREKYGKISLVHLISLAQKGDSVLKPLVSKILAHLEFLQFPFGNLHIRIQLGFSSRSSERCSRLSSCQVSCYV